MAWAQQEDLGQGNISGSNVIQQGQTAVGCGTAALQWRLGPRRRAVSSVWLGPYDVNRCRQQVPALGWPRRGRRHRRLEWRQQQVPGGDLLEPLGVGWLRQQRGAANEPLALLSPAPPLSAPVLSATIRPLRRLEPHPKPRPDHPPARHHQAQQRDRRPEHRCGRRLSAPPTTFAAARGHTLAGRVDSYAWQTPVASADLAPAPAATAGTVRENSARVPEQVSAAGSDPLGLGATNNRRPTQRNCLQPLLGLGLDGLDWEPSRHEQGQDKGRKRQRALGGCQQQVASGGQIFFTSAPARPSLARAATSGANAGAPRRQRKLNKEQATQSCKIKLRRHWCRLPDNRQIQHQTANFQQADSNARRKFNFAEPARPVEWAAGGEPVMFKSPATGGRGPRDVRLASAGAFEQVVTTGGHYARADRLSHPAQRDLWLPRCCSQLNLNSNFSFSSSQQQSTIAKGPSSRQADKRHPMHLSSSAGQTATTWRLQATSFPSRQNHATICPSAGLKRPGQRVKAYINLSSGPKSPASSSASQAVTPLTGDTNSTNDNMHSLEIVDQRARMSISIYDPLPAPSKKPQQQVAASEHRFTFRTGSVQTRASPEVGDGDQRRRPAESPAPTSVGDDQAEVALEGRSNEHRPRRLADIFEIDGEELGAAELAAAGRRFESFLVASIETEWSERSRKLLIDLTCTSERLTERVFEELLSLELERRPVASLGPAASSGDRLARMSPIGERRLRRLRRQAVKLAKLLHWHSGDFEQPAMGSSGPTSSDPLQGCSSPATARGLAGAQPIDPTAMSQDEQVRLTRSERRAGGGGCDGGDELEPQVGGEGPKMKFLGRRCCCCCRWKQKCGDHAGEPLNDVVELSSSQSARGIDGGLGGESKVEGLGDFTTTLADATPRRHCRGALDLKPAAELRLEPEPERRLDGSPGEPLKALAAQSAAVAAPMARGLDCGAKSGTRCEQRRPQSSSSSSSCGPSHGSFEPAHWLGGARPVGSAAASLPEASSRLGCGPASARDLNEADGDQRRRRRPSELRPPDDNGDEHRPTNRQTSPRPESHRFSDTSLGAARGGRSSSSCSAEPPTARDPKRAASCDNDNYHDESHAERPASRVWRLASSTCPSERAPPPGETDPASEIVAVGAGQSLLCKLQQQQQQQQQQATSSQRQRMAPKGGPKPQQVAPAPSKTAQINHQPIQKANHTITNQHNHKPHSNQADRDGGPSSGKTSVGDSANPNGPQQSDRKLNSAGPTNGPARAAVPGAVGLVTGSMTYANRVRAAIRQQGEFGADRPGRHPGRPGGALCRCCCRFHFRLTFHPTSAPPPPHHRPDSGATLGAAEGMWTAGRRKP